jgi:hypothetical protein
MEGGPAWQSGGNGLRLVGRAAWSERAEGGWQAGPGYSVGWHRQSVGLVWIQIQIQTVQNKFKQFQTLAGQKSTFPCLEKLKKYGFEDLEGMNNFLHINFSRFIMDLKLKLKEISRLEFDKNWYSFFLKLWIWMKPRPRIVVCT